MSKQKEKANKTSNYIFSWNRNNRILFVALSFVGILIFLAIVATSNFESNIRTADTTSNLLLEQIQTVFDQNDEEETVLINSLKDDYITRAKAVARFIADNPTIVEDSSELETIADLVNVDEINIFDTQGVIYAGTVAEYFGVGMDSGDQIGYFEPMLSDTDLTMCQDMTPNTAEGKSMMYAMVWGENDDCLVQVGIEPDHLLEEMNTHSVDQVVDSMPMTEGLGVYVVDRATGEIMGATDHDYIGKTLEDFGLVKDDNLLDVSHTKKLGEKYYRLLFEEYNSYGIGVMYEMNVIQKGLFKTLLAVFLYLFIFVLAVGFILDILGKKNRREELLIQDSNTDALTGCYNRRAFDEAIEELRKGKLPPEMVYLSVDINGLKNTNDTLGHVAGDELILGAVSCLKTVFEQYGKIYRTGGDEFIGLLYMKEEKIEEKATDFEKTVAEWSGSKVKSLSVSTGYVRADETDDISKMAFLADKRMYAAKAEYYKDRNRDRRNRETEKYQFGSDH